MTDEEFEAACNELSNLANKVADGTPEQIRTFVESGWWDAMDTLSRVYNDWLLDCSLTHPA